MLVLGYGNGGLRRACAVPCVGWSREGYVAVTCLERDRVKMVTPVVPIVSMSYRGGSLHWLWRALGR